MTVEEYIKKYTRNCSNELAYKDESGKSIYRPWLTPENAEAVAIIAREEKLKELWKDAQGDDLPVIDREVIALQGRKVVFAYRPNPERFIDKELYTGSIRRFYPQTYDKGGWNIEGVTYWLDIDLPEEIE